MSTRPVAHTGKVVRACEHPTVHVDRPVQSTGGWLAPERKRLRVTTQHDQTRSDTYFKAVISFTDTPPELAAVSEWSKYLGPDVKMDPVSYFEIKIHVSSPTGAGDRLARHIGIAWSAKLQSREYIDLTQSYFHYSETSSYFRIEGSIAPRELQITTQPTPLGPREIVLAAMGWQQVHPEFVLSGIRWESEKDAGSEGTWTFVSRQS